MQKRGMVITLLDDIMGKIINGLYAGQAIYLSAVDMGGCIIVVKKVPSCVCGQCGEASYSDEVSRRLEQIVHGVMDSAGAEIAVVSYSEKTA